MRLLGKVMVLMGPIIIILGTLGFFQIPRMLWITPYSLMLAISGAILLGLGCILYILGCMYEADYLKELLREFQEEEVANVITGYGFGTVTWLTVLSLSKQIGLSGFIAAIVFFVLGVVFNFFTKKEQWKEYRGLLLIGSITIGLIGLMTVILVR